MKKKENKEPQNKIQDPVRNLQDYKINEFLNFLNLNIERQRARRAKFRN
jgi:hypothetical protein